MEQLKSGLKLGGLFECEVYDKDGNLKWTQSGDNIISNQGLGSLMNIMLGGSTQITAWYCCLIESNTTASGTMTYAITVYTESVAYDEPTRPTYGGSVSSGGTITNSANKAVFTINATKTMYGAAVVGGGTAAMTKADVASVGGRLLCYSLFSPSRAVVDDDVINLTYTISAADDAI